MMINWDSSPERWKEKQKLFMAEKELRLSKQVNYTARTGMISAALLKLVQEKLHGEPSQAVKKQRHIISGASTERRKKPKNNQPE